MTIAELGVIGALVLGICLVVVLAIGFLLDAVEDAMARKNAEDDGPSNEYHAEEDV